MRTRWNADPDPDPRLDPYRCRVAIMHRGGEPCGYLYLEADVWTVGVPGRWWWSRTQWSESQEAMQALWVLGGEFAGDEYIGPDEFDDVLGHWDAGVDRFDEEQFRLVWQDRETAERLPSAER